MLTLLWVTGSSLSVTGCGGCLFHDSPHWPPAAAARGRGGVRLAEHRPVNLQGGVAGLPVEDLAEAFGSFPQVVDRLHRNSQESINAPENGTK